MGGPLSKERIGYHLGGMASGVLGFLGRQALELPGYEHHRQHKGNKIGNRSGQQYTKNTELQGEDQNQGDQEKHLPREREQQSFQGFSNGGKEVGGEQLHTVYDHHEQESAHE